jgi:predicted nucleic acid-binding Zn ribbon protein
MDKPKKNKAKSLKLGENDIICPSCNSVLTISEDIKDDELIQCAKCEAAIQNPFFYSGKFVICSNCGNNAELPKDIENELIVNCGGCGQDIINPHSKDYNPLNCPHCFMDIHIPEEIIHERYILCPNCQNDFKNTLRKKKNVDIVKQNHIKPSPEQKTTSNTTTDNINESKEFTKQQINWFIGIVIFIVIIILLIGNYKPSVPYIDNKPIIEKEQKKRSPEIIYTKIKKALADDFPGTCKILFNEMQTDYPNSILFDSVKIIYDSAMNIVQLKKEEARKKRKIYEATKKKETKQVKQSKFLKVFAQAYSDGILSCNVYLTDKSGDIHYLNANSISYSIYDFHNNRIKPTGNISKSNTSDGLFIDIPLGTNVFKAKSISFVISTSQGVTYKSNNVSIDY